MEQRGGTLQIGMGRVATTRLRLLRLSQPPFPCRPPHLPCLHLLASTWSWLRPTSAALTPETVPSGEISVMPHR